MLGQQVSHKVHIALICDGLTKELVFYSKPYNIDVLVFLNKNDAEAKHEISEMSYQDRAEWVGMISYRAYSGWKRSDVVEMEELLKSKDATNEYYDY
jgi:hypothetical protein